MTAKMDERLTVELQAANGRGLLEDLLLLVLSFSV